MQKKITLKDFKVLLFKKIFAFLFLSIFVQGSQAQVGKMDLAIPTTSTIEQPKDLQVANKVTATTKLGKLTSQHSNVFEPIDDVPFANKKSGAKSNVQINNAFSIPSPNNIVPVCTFAGTLAPGDAVIASTGRLGRDGVQSACGVTKTCFGPSGTGPYYYDTYTMQNLTCASQCVTVNCNNNGTVGTHFVSAYLNSFNPLSLCTNYIADEGASPANGSSLTFSFTLAANATLVLVVTEPNIGETNNSYLLTVTGLNCNVPVCTPATSSIISQALVPQSTVNLINESFSNAALPANWAQLNLSNPISTATFSDWFQGSTGGSFAANSAPDFRGASFLSGNGTATLSNWLFTPNVLLKNGDKFSFYTRTVSGTFPDRMQVRLSTNGTSTNVGTTATSVGDFSTLLFDINPTYTGTGYPSTWTQYIATISGMPAAGISGRLAFRYFVENGGPNGANSNFIGIDDVLYSTTLYGPPTTCAGSTANLVVNISGGNGTLYDVTIHPSIGSDFTVQNYTSGANIPVTPTGATTYTLVKVVASDNPCCIGTGNSGSVTLTPSATTTTPITITGSPSGALCSGSSTLLTATSTASLTGYTYLWTPTSGLSNTTAFQVGASPATTTTYSVLATAPNGCQTTANYLVNINDLPAVTLNPVDVTVCPGANATFTAAGTGTGKIYTWQVSTNGGTTWTNLTNVAPYVGVNTGSLTVTSAISMLGNQYRLAVSGTCTPIAFSSAAKLLFNPLPVVSITPSGALCGGVAGISGTQITVGSPPPPVPGSTSFNSGAISVAVPDNSIAATTATLPVSGIAANATVTGLTVTLTMPHTWIGDMVFVLKAPNGNIINLDHYLSRTGGAAVSTGFSNTRISSSGTAALSTGTNPFTNTFAADASTTNVTFNLLAPGPTGFLPNVNKFDSLYSTPNGTWTLAMYDGGPGDVGTLTSWSLKVDYNTPGTASAVTSTWSPAAGLYTNATATTPYVAGSAASTVYAAPTAFTIYTVTSTDNTTGCSSTGTVAVNYTPAAPIVAPNPVSMCLGDAAVKLKSTAQGITTATFTSGTVNIAIPDGNPVIPPVANPATTSNITVSGIPALPISNIRVKLNITHTYIGDLVIVLKAPNGNVFNLDAILNKTDNPGSGFTNTIISSAGTTLLSAGTTPFTATFKPDAVGATFTAFGITFPGGPVGYIPNVTTFNQLYSQPNGVWTLAIYDIGAPDFGTLNNWSMDIDYVSSVSAPAKWSPAAGLFSDAAATIPYNLGTVIDSVFTKPTPSGVYNYQATIDSKPPTAVNTTTSTIAAAFVASTITFNVKNNNSYPIIINGLTSYANTAGATVATGFYNTSAINGPPGAITAANGWTTFGTNSFTAVAGVQTFLSNVSVTIPPGSTYGFCVQGQTATATNNLVFGNAASLVTFSNAGVDIVTGPNIGYAGNAAVPPNPAFTPYGYIGSLLFTAAPPVCTSPPQVVIVTVNQPISITTQPISSVLCSGANTSFTVAVTGTTPIYQWQVSTNGGTTYTAITDGGVYFGSSTKTLSITGSTTTMNGYKYICIVGGAGTCGSVTSSAVTLTVNPTPVVSISASPYTKLFPGLTTTISSTSTPAVGLNGYTWMKNGTVLSNTSSASTLPINVDGMGIYSLSIVDVNGCKSSSNSVIISDSAIGKLFIYPNPNRGQFQVRYYSSPNTVGLPRGMNVFDAVGKRVLSQTYPINSPYSRMDVDLRNQGTGVYWIEIVDLNGNRLATGRVEVLR